MKKTLTNVNSCEKDLRQQSKLEKQKPVQNTSYISLLSHGGGSATALNQPIQTTNYPSSTKNANSKPITNRFMNITTDNVTDLVDNQASRNASNS